MFRDFEDEFFGDTGGLPTDLLGQSRSSRQRQSLQGRTQGKELSLWSDPFSGRSLMPFGGGLFGGGLFGGMDSMFENMRREMENNPNAHCYSSSSVMTYSSDGSGGAPRVYQASSSTRSGPGGVKEVKKSVMDSESGVKKAAIEHHIGDRSHAVERSYNMKTSEAAQNERLTNLDEAEVGVFDKEWTQKTKPLNEAVGYLAGPSQAGRRPALPAGKAKRLPPIQVERHATTSLTSDNDDPLKGQDVTFGGGSQSRRPKVPPIPQASEQPAVSRSASSKLTSPVGSSRMAGRERGQYLETNGQGQGHHGAAERNGQGGVKKKVKLVG